MYNAQLVQLRLELLSCLKLVFGEFQHFANKRENAELTGQV